MELCGWGTRSTAPCRGWIPSAGSRPTSCASAAVLTRSPSAPGRSGSRTGTPRASVGSILGNASSFRRFQSETGRGESRSTVRPSGSQTPSTARSRRLRRPPVRLQRVEAVAPGVSSIVASGGAIWVASPPASKVFRLDRESGQVTDSIEMGSSPSALAAGTDDTVWAAALPPASRHRGGTLVVSAYLSGCNCLDPAFAWQADAWRALSMLYDGLVAYRKTGGAPGATLVPDLAVNLPIPTDGGRTYRFQLRKGLEFSDGSPVRASDFRASMERLLRLNASASHPSTVGSSALNAAPRSSAVVTCGKGSRSTTRLAPSRFTSPRRTQTCSPSLRFRSRSCFPPTPRSPISP